MAKFRFAPLQPFELLQLELLLPEFPLLHEAPLLQEASPLRLVGLLPANGAGSNIGW